MLSAAACGYAGYNTPACLWSVWGFTHRLGLSRSTPRVQLAGFARVYTQLRIKMYTVCAQIFRDFVSVNTPLVHTIHTAYREHSKVNKGKII